MMTSEAPAPSLSRANVAGNQAISQADGSQQTPRTNDAPAHIRTVRQILELAAEWSRTLRHVPSGDVLLQRAEVADIENCLGLALELLTVEGRARSMAQTIADFTPGLVAIDPRDPEQLALLIPPQSAPAFKRRAAR